MKPDQLKRLAFDASARSYSPYSKFAVGAVVVTENDAFVLGANIENASYGLTICAERVALFNNRLQSLDRVIEIGIYTHTDKPSTPCGACRQVIYELARFSSVFCFCKSSDIIHLDAERLLPDAFELPEAP